MGAKYRIDENSTCENECYGGRNGWGKCMKEKDCHHKEQMSKAPKYLHEIVDYYYFALRGFDDPIRAPKRMKFKWPGTFMGYSPITVYSGVEYNK